MEELFVWSERWSKQGGGAGALSRDQVRSVSAAFCPSLFRVSRKLQLESLEGDPLHLGTQLVHCSPAAPSLPKASPIPS